MSQSSRIIARDAGVHPTERWRDEIPHDQAISIFKQTCYNRYFEYEVAKAHDAGLIKMPIYLSLGQEHIPSAVAAAMTKPMIFAQHRAHSYYLSFGGDEAQLVDELLHQPSGCAGGMGGSASIHYPDIGMFGHSGLMGDQVPIAVGAALGSGKQVLTVVGDASAEEDYVYGAMGYAASKSLPILFLCEDNNLSILTEVSTRRSWSMVDVARGVGLNAVELVEDDPWYITTVIGDLCKKLPAFINIQTCRHHWHAGTGMDGEPAWNRFEITKNILCDMGYAEEVGEMEHNAKESVSVLWSKRIELAGKSEGVY